MDGLERALIFISCVKQIKTDILLYCSSADFYFYQKALCREETDILTESALGPLWSISRDDGGNSGNRGGWGGGGSVKKTFGGGDGGGGRGEQKKNL